MARTIVKWGKTSEVKRPSRAKMVRKLKDMYESDQRNEDVCGDVDDALYYQGRMDSIHDVLYSFYGWKVKQ